MRSYHRQWSLYRPHVEPIEARVLPGETLGMLLLSPWAASPVLSPLTADGVPSGYLWTHGLRDKSPSTHDTAALRPETIPLSPTHGGNDARAQPPRTAAGKVFGDAPLYGGPGPHGQLLAALGSSTGGEAVPLALDGSGGGGVTGVDFAGSSVWVAAAGGRGEDSNSGVWESYASASASDSLPGFPKCPSGNYSGDGAAAAALEPDTHTVILAAVASGTAEGSPPETAVHSSSGWQEGVSVSSPSGAYTFDGLRLYFEYAGISSASTGLVCAYGKYSPGQRSVASFSIIADGGRQSVRIADDLLGPAGEVGTNVAGYGEPFSLEIPFGDFSTCGPGCMNAGFSLSLQVATSSLSAEAFADFWGAFTGYELLGVKPGHDLEVSFQSTS